MKLIIERVFVMNGLQQTIAAIKIGKRQMMELTNGKIVKAIILTVICLLMAIPALIFSKKYREAVKLRAQDIREEVEGA